MLSHLSCAQLFRTPGPATPQAPPFMGFSRQEYWGGFAMPSAGDLPNPGMDPQSHYVSCIGRQVLLPLVPPVATITTLYINILIE